MNKETIRASGARGAMLLGVVLGALMLAPSGVRAQAQVALEASVDPQQQEPPLLNEDDVRAGIATQPQRMQERQAAYMTRRRAHGTGAELDTPPPRFPDPLPPDLMGTGGAR